MNYRWVDLLGVFDEIDGGRVFMGREFIAPIEPSDSLDKQAEPPNAQQVVQPTINGKKYG
jgi:hypothetical protein